MIGKRSLMKNKNKSFNETKENNFLLEDSVSKRLINFWQSFRPEIILISMSLLLIVVSLTIFLRTNLTSEKNLSLEEEKKPISNFQLPISRIFIDLSGAVQKPDVYEVTPGARLKDVLVLAGGLSSEADRQFFSRNFNMARVLVDQEKIYIPSIWEVQQGLFQESTFVLDQINPKVINNQLSIQDQNQETEEQKININIATVEELDTLPGVGKVTAKKIIDNRPYQSTEELLTKKAVGKSVYEKIKDLITIN